MKKLLFMTAILAAVLLLILADLHAWKGFGSYHYGAKSYNVNSVKTVTGDVTNVENFKNGGVHITVRAKKVSHYIHLGPGSFIRPQIEVKKGDRVTVIGSEVKFKGALVILARSIRKGNKTVQLRKNDGTPLWAGHGGYTRKNKCCGRYKT